MATRNVEGSRKLTVRQQENTRANIARKVTQISDRLAKHAVAETDENGKLTTDMTSTQVKAAQILLDKCVPNLQSIAYTDEGGQESATEEELMERLSAWIVKNPKLLDVLKARGVTVEPEKEQLAGPQHADKESREPDSECRDPDTKYRETDK